jgi:hypothetical protein
MGFSDWETSGTEIRVQKAVKRAVREECPQFFSHHGLVHTFLVREAGQPSCETFLMPFLSLQFFPSQAN